MLVKQRLPTSKVDLVNSKFMQFFDQLEPLVFPQLLLLISTVETFQNVAELAFVVAALFQMEVYGEELVFGGGRRRI